MATFTLTTGTDNVTGTAGADKITATITTLTAGDKISGNGGNDTLQLTGGGTFDLTLLASLTSVEIITLDKAGSTLQLRDGMDVTVNAVGGNDTILSANGNDTVNAGAGSDSVSGGVGNDRLNGEGDDDTLMGGDGLDTLDGGGGSDNLSGDAGNDKLAGGAGNDVLDGGADNDSLLGEGGNDTLIGSGGTDQLDGGADNDSLSGEAGNDMLSGAGGDDSLDGGADNDSLLGGAGLDILGGGAGNDTLDGGTGIDTATYAGVISALNIDLSLGTAAGEGLDTLLNIENVIGGQANDTITGANSVNNQLEGGSGNDSLVGGGSLDSTNDTLLGGSGNDTLVGVGGNDRLDGGADIDTASYAGNTTSAVTVDLGAGTVTGAGNDTLLNIENVIGGQANDTITGANSVNNQLEGGSGNDSLVGGGSLDSTNDTLLGGSGNDTLVGVGGDDRLDGGADIDTASYAGNTTSAVTVDLGAGTVTGAGNDTLLNIENVIGGQANDTIIGDGKVNDLFGAKGSDELLGGDGNDVLQGGEGDDTLAGQVDVDVLTGGAGKDDFSGSTSDWNGDTITDYEYGETIAVAFGSLSTDDYQLRADGGDTYIDYDADGVGGFDGSIKLSGTINGVITVTQQNEYALLTITRPPAITSDGGGETAAIQVAENNAAVTTVTAVDPDAGDTVTFSIAGGFDGNLFTIDDKTGALSFLTAPDFENPDLNGGGFDQFYDVAVRATDSQGLFDEQLITVTVTDVNEAPAITSDGGGETAAVEVAENGKAVTTVSAVDPDAGDTVTFSIAGGFDGNLFTIDSQTGALSFLTAPDFENPDLNGGGFDQFYDVAVRATDSQGLFDEQLITVTVTDVNEAPAITSDGGGETAAIQVAENNAAVTTVTAVDPDAGDAVTFSIAGGFDGNLFAIDSQTGALSFITAPDFENPDLNGGGFDQFYDVLVRATDSKGLFDEQLITVTVTDVNEAPLFTTAADNVDFNTVSAGSYAEGTQYDALAGADSIVLPADAAAAATAGYDWSQQFDAGIGDDSVTGGTLADLIDGGADNDLLHGDAGDDTVTGGAGNDLLRGGSSLLGEANDGNDVLYGAAGLDDMWGGHGNDTLSGGDDDDYMVGGEGDDAVYGEAANDYIHGYDGNDMLDGGAGNDLMFGSPGSDQMSGASGDDTLDAGDDNDTANGGDGADAIDGGADNDLLHGDAGDDTVTGGAGNDLLRGGSSLLGEANDGNDVLYGAAGLDDMWGGYGNDTLSGGDDDDYMVGGEGDDAVYGEAANDYIHGYDGNDTLDGGAGNDLMFGSPGSDQMSGASGDDTLDAGDDNDTVTGGGGSDYLTGADGSDRFDYNAISEAGDEIADFQIGSGGDVLDVADLLVGYGGGDLEALGFVELSSSGTDTVVNVDVDGAAVGGASFTTLATLSGVAFGSVTVGGLVADGNLDAVV